MAEPSSSSRSARVPVRVSAESSRRRASVSRALTASVRSPEAVDDALHLDPLALGDLPRRCP